MKVSDYLLELRRKRRKIESRRIDGRRSIHCW
jgi:hypothetical protein